MGQSNGVLLKEVVSFQRCPLIEIPLYVYTVCTYVCTTYCKYMLFVIAYVPTVTCTVWCLLCLPWSLQVDSRYHLSALQLHRAMRTLLAIAGNPNLYIEPYVSVSECFSETVC